MLRVACVCACMCWHQGSSSKGLCLLRLAFSAVHLGTPLQPCVAVPALLSFAGLGCLSTFWLMLPALHVSWYPLLSMLHVFSITPYCLYCSYWMVHSWQQTL